VTDKQCIFYFILIFPYFVNSSTEYVLGVQQCFDDALPCNVLLCTRAVFVVGPLLLSVTWAGIAQSV
jgi:hypothetical protein